MTGNPSITLPWPPKELSPNARKHWRVKHGYAQSYKRTAWALAKEARLKAPETGVTLVMTFHPPSARKADTDNMLASCKHAIDGIAEAIGRDDSTFGYRIRRGDPIKGGKVIISVE